MVVEFHNIHGLLLVRNAAKCVASVWFNFWWHIWMGSWWIILTLLASLLFHTIKNNNKNPNLSNMAKFKVNMTYQQTYLMCHQKMDQTDVEGFPRYAYIFICCCWKCKAAKLGQKSNISQKQPHKFIPHILCSFSAHCSHKPNLLSFAWGNSEIPS